MEGEALVALFACVGWLLGAVATATVPHAIADAGGSTHPRSMLVAPEHPVDPLHLSPALVAWAVAQVPTHGTPEARTDALLRALSRRGLFPDEQTRTAEEVFATGRYNCLGLATLLVPMARAVGVDAHFVRILDLETPVDLGGTVVVSGHVAAAFGAPGQLRVVDPVPTTDEQLRAASRLSDVEAAALYHVNRGAEETLAGEPAAALRWFALAEALAPALPELWVDRGVALARLDRPDEARAAYEHALELDPRDGSAWRNLARLLSEAGDPNAARASLEALSGRLRRDPLTQLALGDAWLSVGDPERALQAYRAALFLGGKPAVVLAARSVAADAAGRTRAGARWFARAERLDPEHPRVVRARLLRSTTR
jgi:Flp pilus assembly protein TadD